MRRRRLGCRDVICGREGRKRLVVRKQRIITENPESTRSYSGSHFSNAGILFPAVMARASRTR